MKKGIFLLTSFLLSTIIMGCEGGKKPTTVGIKNYPINEEFLYSKKMQDRFYDMPVRVSNDRYGTHLAISTDELFKDQEKPMINPLVYPTLNRVVEVVNLYPTRKITVAGFTDDLFTPQQQEVLSEKYARVVADYLLSQGVDGSRIINVEGEGIRNPVADNDNYLSRAANRRVEIIIHAQID